MKRLTGLWVAMGCFLFSCGNGNDDPIPQEEIVPQLVSTQPEANVSLQPVSQPVTFVFAGRVGIVDKAKITLNNQPVSNVSVAENVLTVQLDALEESASYILTIDVKAIKAIPGVMNKEAISFTFTTGALPPFTPPPLAVKNPSPQVLNLYNFLKENYGQKIISGAMANVNWNIAEAELVHKATGKYPAMAVFDYIHLFASPANWIDYSNTQIVEDWWNNNGLVGACWHWFVPRYENAAVNDVTYEPEKTTFRARNATVEGTWENKVVKADLAKIADYLKLLKDKNIPVIWRPLHEGAGNIYVYTNGKAWFWWGYDGAEAYKKLWRYMFDYFQSQGLNNLIWVWTTQTKDDAFYPGDEYVDIIGRDIYSQTAASENWNQFQLISNDYPNKMVALSECGKVATIPAQWSAGAKWSFFMPWYQGNAVSLDGHEHADTAWWKDAFASDKVISRDQMPSLK